MTEYSFYSKPKFAWLIYSALQHIWH